MTVVPEHSRSEVDSAGEILRDSTGSQDEQQWALEVLDNWRAAHNYPINTFQATLRTRLKVAHRTALVAQRLKRIPSILDKLRRFPTMELSQIQDIGGLRAIVQNVDDVAALYEYYKNSVKFGHELANEKNYIDNPKPSGYRGVHLIYRYNNSKAPAYQGLLLEMQIRTVIQHAWATTVETMGTFLNHALKSNQGPDEWLKFFATTGSAFARLEGSRPVPEYEDMSATETYREVATQSKALQVKERLVGLRLATGHISRFKSKGGYFLLMLDPEARRIVLQPFGKDRFDEATAKYLQLEGDTRGTQKQVVLVSTASVTQVKKAYPNFFLDTTRFLQILRQIEQIAGES